MRLVVLAALALLVLAPAAVEAQSTATVGVKESGCSPAAGQDRTFCWDQDTLTLAGGAEATVTLQNNGNTPHSLCVEGLQGGERCTPNPEAGTPGGSSATVTFTPPSAGGSLTYYCKVPGHRDLGMVGSLTVTPGATTPPSTPPTTPPGTPPPGGDRDSPLPPLAFVAAGIVLLALALRPSRRE